MSIGTRTLYDEDEYRDVMDERDAACERISELRGQLAELEKNLLDEVADYLAAEGYPWTANDIRSGTWRKKKGS